MMATVTRTELAEAACLNGEVTKTEARDLVDQCLKMISDALAAGDKVLISGFGVFKIRHKSDRIGRNPSELHIITARRVAGFRASLGLKKAVDDGMRGSRWLPEIERRVIARNR